MIPADPDILKKLNPDNAVVLANAMNSRYDFVSTVIGRGVHYCLSLKGNQNRTQDEIRSLFNTTRQEHIITSHPWAERTPGRTDYRVSIIRGTLLSDIILDRWQGLKEGCIVRVERTDFQQSAKKEVLEDRFFISSISPVRENIQRVYEITSMHWSMDHSSLWCLDMRYSQERMQGNDPEYIASCCALNKPCVPQ